MATNERENARRERARKKDKKVKTIIWIILGIIIVALFVMKICEFDFNSLKNKFVGSDGKISVSMTTDADSYPYQLDTSSGVRVSSNNDKICVLTGSSFSVLNPSDAAKLYSFDHGFASPVIRYSGNYVCLFDQGGTRLRVDTMSDNVYQHSFSKNILTADVSNNGTVICATHSDDAKSDLVVLSKSLSKNMDIAVKDGYVVSVAIDSSGKKCAYATINSKNAVLKTTIHTINTAKDAEDIATFTFDNTNILDMHYCGSSLYVVADNGVAVVSSQKNIEEVFPFGTISTVDYTYADGDELVIDYTDFSGANENTVAFVKTNGKVRTSIPIDRKIKSLSSTSREITVLFSDKIVNYAVTSGEKRSSVKCDDSVCSANTISSKTFVRRGQMLDVME